MKHKVTFGRRLAVVLCSALALACAAPARAQSATQEPRPRKVSDYVNLFTSCNAGAHLDNFAIELQNEPDASGYVVVYGPGGPGGQFARRAIEATRGYLITTRGIEESRVEAVYGGLSGSMQELLTELWLVPQRAEPPPKSIYKPDTEAEGKYAEFESWDGLSEGEGEGWGSSTEVALVGLSDLMRRREKTLAYVVAYNGAESAPGAWRRIAEREVGTLRENGVAAGRVKVIFGGYAEEAKVGLWILPPDAPPPAKEARERRPERSVKVASLGNYQLKDADGERWAFKGLADVLKADGQLTGCLIVRLAPAELEDADLDSPADRAEPPGLDLTQLPEKWKAELKKNGVGEHRLIVMVVPPREGQWGAEIETWVVPPGAPLPDPSAVDEASGAEEVNPKEF
ncbi:MAG TPA: hypothetical protein VF611_09795 [Pyrinomonadaceae bacterium]